jgi:PPOX class probable F420-dependent enzyme
MELATALDFIRDRKNGVLTTQKRDGRPQLSNITYALGDDGIVRISITAGRAKAKNLARDPRASLHVTREDFYAYAVLECDVELMPVAQSVDDATVDALVEYYETVRGGHDDWDEYRRTMVADGRLLLLLAPTRAYGMLSA